VVPPSVSAITPFPVPSHSGQGGTVSVACLAQPAIIQYHPRHYKRIAVAGKIDSLLYWINIISQLFGGSRGADPPVAGFCCDNFIFT